VLRMQNEVAVDKLRGGAVRLCPLQHPQQVGRVAKLAVGRNRLESLADRECPATTMATCEVRRMPLRNVASRELSPTSGSNAESAETAVRNTSIGWAGSSRG
jgi:hypothetical protein